MPWSCGAKGCRTHSSAEHACPGWTLSSIQSSVGQGGVNRKADVQVIQGGLNRVGRQYGGPWPRLATDGVSSFPTVQAIKAFQTTFFGTRKPDGRVDVNRRTYQALARKLRFKYISVSLPDQMLAGFENGRRVYQFPCLTGDSDHPTNKGTFSIIRKRHPYRSHKYDVDMNYAMFFTADGKAIHQYHGVAGLIIVRDMRQAVSDWFGSHGCVRLEEAHAKALFRWAPQGTRVVVF